MKEPWEIEIEKFDKEVRSKDLTYRYRKISLGDIDRYGEPKLQEYIRKSRRGKIKNRKPIEIEIIWKRCVKCGTKFGIVISSVRKFKMELDYCSIGCYLEKICS